MTTKPKRIPNTKPIENETPAPPTAAPEPAPIDTLPWHPVPSPCPRCAQPIKVRTTPTISKVTELLCTKCGWRMDVETVRLDLQPCTIRAGRLNLEMIFRNLLDNAVKYAATDPQVEVSLRPTSDGGSLTRIADNGRGVPYKLRRKIFGRFVRLGLELEREKPGTGLGLYIVRTLVRRLRGRIRVRDREKGPGTTFEVQLPGGPAGKTKSDPKDGA